MMPSPDLKKLLDGIRGYRVEGDDVVFGPYRVSVEHGAVVVVREIESDVAELVVDLLDPNTALIRAVSWCRMMESFRRNREMQQAWRRQQAASQLEDLGIE